MPNVSGPKAKNRAWCLIQALFLQAEAEESRIKPVYAGISITKYNWEANSNQAPVLLVENATKDTLNNLIDDWKKKLIEQWKSNNFKDLKITPEDIRDTLNYSLKFDSESSPLRILEDLRDKIRGNDSKIRSFYLHLWGTTLEENRRGFDQEWGNPKLRKPFAPKPNIRHQENFDSISTGKETGKDVGSQSLNSSLSVPSQAAINFVGRKQELETLHRVLHSKQRVAISAIAGMGGIGKTELAIKYKKDYEAHYPGGICWLRDFQGIKSPITRMIIIVSKRGRRSCRWQLLLPFL